MKAYLLFNELVAATIVFLAVIYVVLYFTVIKKRERPILTPIRALSAVLCLALVVSSVGNYIFFKDANSKRGKYNRVDVVPITQETSDMYASIYAQFADSDSLSGYNKTVKYSNDIKYTCHLIKYPEDHIYPGFVIFIEYDGKEDTSSFKWFTVSIDWRKNGSLETEVSSDVHNHTTKLMLVGDYDTSIEELCIRTDYDVSEESGGIVSERTVIPINVINE